MTALAISSMLFCLAVTQTGPASRPASQAVVPVGGKITDLYAELTVIYELGDNALRAKESWRFRNEGSYQLSPELFQITLPAGTRRVRLDENSAPFNLSDTTLGLASPLPPGEHSLGLTYEFPLSGGSADIQQYFAFRMGGVRIIMENMPGLQSTLQFRPQTHKRPKRYSLRHLGPQPFWPRPGNESGHFWTSYGANLDAGPHFWACVLVLYGWVSHSERSAHLTEGIVTHQQNLMSALHERHGYSMPLMRSLKTLNKM